MLSSEPSSERLRPCPFCLHAGAEPYFPYATVWRGKRFVYHRCERCDCTFADPAPSEDDLAAMYAHGDYHEEHYSTFEPAAYAPSIGWLGRHREGRGTLLDVGCGNGSFMAAARTAGHAPVGTELDPVARAAAAARTGLPVLSMDELRSSKQRFDVIHLGDVLEHLVDPIGYMRSLEALLRPHGSFFLEGPLQSHDSVVFHTARAFKLVQRKLGRDSPGVEPPTHLILATMASQRAFFQSTLGYEELAFEVSETGWPYLSSGEPRGLRARVRHTIGVISLVAAAVTRNGTRPWGNRFRGLYSVGRTAP